MMQFPELPEHIPTAIEKYRDEHESIEVYRLKITFKTLDIMQKRKMDGMAFSFKTDSLHSALMVVETLYMFIDRFTASFGSKESKIKFNNVYAFHEHAANLTVNTDGDFSYNPYVKSILTEWKNKPENIF